MNNYLRKIYITVSIVLSLVLLISRHASVDNENIKMTDVLKEKTYQGVSRGYNGNIEY